MLLRYSNRSLRACIHTICTANPHQIPLIRPSAAFILGQPAPPPVLHRTRNFSSTSINLKKKQKSSNDNNTPPPPSTDDLLDLSPLESDLDSAITRLKAALSQLRTGGRFNPATLEALRVTPDRSSKTSYPLRDLAQVVPRPGRELHLLVADAAHTKPVSSAVQASGLAVRPDPTGQNPNLLVVAVPPPTAESRRAVVDEAGKAGAQAADALRNARGMQQKKFRRMEVEKTVRGDDLRRAGTKMEELVRKKGDEVKKIVEAAKKALDA